MIRFDKIPERLDYVDEVYRVLLDAISDGTLAPGTRLTQEEIAEQFAVSRSPVLQALRLLKKDGLVQDAPGRGVQVAPLDVAWVIMLYEIRGALDTLAARLAAQRSAHIDRKLITQGRRISKSTDVKAMIDADMAFHNAIYEASGNLLIGERAHMHWAHLRRIMGTVLRSSKKQRDAIWDEHEAMADAIAAGNVQLAVRLTERHIHTAKNNYAGQLGAELER